MSKSAKKKAAGASGRMEDLQEIFDPLKALWAKIPRNIKVTFFAAVIVGLLAHMFFITNKFHNADDITLYDTMEWVWMSGRWMMHYIMYLSGPFSVPWLKGVFTIVFTGAAAGVVSYCFNIRQTLSCILVGGLMASFPAITAMMPYTIHSDVYAAAIFISALAAFLTYHYRYGFIPGAALVMAATAIYQVYLFSAAAIMLGMLILELLRGPLDIRAFLIKGAKCLAALVIGLAAYLFVTLVIFPNIIYPGQRLNDYMGISSMGQTPPGQYPALIGKALEGLKNVFFGNLFNITPAGLRLAFGLAALAGAARAAYIVVRKQIYKKATTLLLLLFLLFAYLVSVNGVYLMNADGVGLRMSFCLVYLPVALLALLEVPAEIEKEKKHLRVTLKAASCAILAALVLATHHYTVLANQWYLKANTIYERGYAYSVELVARIRAAEGYRTDTPIVLVGAPENIPIMTVEYPIMDGIGLVDFFPASYSYQFFLERTMGLEQPMLMNPTPEQVHPGVAEMPVYPAAGSLRILGGIMYVKFAEYIPPASN